MLELNPEPTDLRQKKMKNGCSTCSRDAPLDAVVVALVVVEIDKSTSFMTKDSFGPTFTAASSSMSLEFQLLFSAFRIEWVYSY